MLTSVPYTLTGTVGQASPVGVLSTWTLTLQAGFYGGGSASSLSYTLTVRLTGTGSGRVTGAGIDCGADCVETYAAGTTIELTATPAPCSRAVRWEDEAGIPLSSPLTIRSNLTVYAVFEACCPAPVTLLSPANGATNVPIDYSFSWQKAADATSYNMLWGETTPLANPVNTNDAFYFKDSLSPTNTTYYWRVDAVNACGVTPGTVWSLTTEAPFEERPFVITSIEPSLLLLGDSAIVTAHAKDNVGVTAFRVALGDTVLMTAPGEIVYTPTTTGEHVLTATASDADGNVTTSTMTCYVLDPETPTTTAIRFYEAFNPRTGGTDHDSNIMIFAPEDRAHLTEVSFPEGVEESMRFSPSMAFHFVFRRTANSLAALVTEPGTTAALMAGNSFEAVTAADIDAAAFAEWRSGTAVTANNVVLLRSIHPSSGAVSYFKLGKFQGQIQEFQVAFSYQILVR